jgi:hypothetical protein
MPVSILPTSDLPTRFKNETRAPVLRLMRALEFLWLFVF